MIRVAALYIDPRGPYPQLAGVECFDEQRDARTYAGPWPVVAHPPCGPWGSLRSFCTRQNRELAPLAVTQVREWGGVLEHPAHSKLWGHCMLPRPGEGRDAFGGYTIAVDQVSFGHVARKRTWLYVVGVPMHRFAGVFAPQPGARPTHWVSGVHAAKRRGRAPVGIKVCGAEQRRRTPRAFAEFLVGLARSSSRRAA